MSLCISERQVTWNIPEMDNYLPSWKNESVHVRKTGHGTFRTWGKKVYSLVLWLTQLCISGGQRGETCGMRRSTWVHQKISENTVNVGSMSNTHACVFWASASAAGLQLSACPDFVARVDRRGAATAASPWRPRRTWVICTRRASKLERAR